jgi:hypothetical protein
MNINPLEFQESISLELKILQNRVRNLIGPIHWGEEGRYKEAILKNVLKRFLPQNLSLGTGFVIDDTQGELKYSKQIDIIIYDNTYPLFFSEGDFIITSKENVKAIIEVKTSVNASTIREVIQNAVYNGQIANCFNGLFIYECNNSIFRHERLADELLNNIGKVNHMCFGENIFVKYWDEGNPLLNIHLPTYSFYKIEKLSFSYFISNLIHSVINGSNSIWFRYPINSPNGKEDYDLFHYYFEDNEIHKVTSGRMYS